MIQRDRVLTVAHVVGTRPEFVQMTAVVRALRNAGHQSVIIHVGQHYDYLMSEVFFQDLQLPAPDYNLEVGPSNPVRQISMMIARLDEVFAQRQFDWVLVYGDTNSTLAGALVATKMHIPVAHTEAGERSYCKTMPEEINRILVDRIADLHLCISRNAIRQLEKEGITQSVHFIGDVMLDILLQTRDRANSQSSILRRLELTPKNYLLATVHRAANTDDPARLSGIAVGLSSLDEQVIFPVHPRTAQALKQHQITLGSNVHQMDPVGYLDMLALEQNAKMIVTDSGGVLREAFFLGIPCLTLRDEIELIELVWSGWNVLVGSDPQRIWSNWKNFQVPHTHPLLLGDGSAADRLVQILAQAQAKYGWAYDVGMTERQPPDSVDRKTA